MGYRASGEGKAKIKDGTDTELLVKAIRETAYAIGIEELTAEADGNTLEIYLYDSHWDEQDTLAILDGIISPCIEEGTVTFEGDENEQWRYIFNPGRGAWDYQYGTVVYAGELTDEFLTRELTKRGYAVTKGVA